MASQTVQQGWNQATAAMQTTMARGVGSARAAPRKRRKKAKSRSAGLSQVRSAGTGRRIKRRAASSSTKKPARLVKGSAAAKKYMASIRRKRR